MQMETKQESLGVRGESLETDSQQHMRQSLRNSNSVNGSQFRLQLRGGGGSHAMLGEESGSQLAARLNSSTFGTEQVLAPPSHMHAVSGSLHLICENATTDRSIRDLPVLACSVGDPCKATLILGKPLTLCRQGPCRAICQGFSTRLMDCYPLLLPIAVAILL